MGEREDTLLNNTVDTDSPTDQLQLRVVRVAEDEMLRIESGPLQKGMIHESTTRLDAEPLLRKTTILQLIHPGIGPTIL